jgi:hypothetical protein
MCIKEGKERRRHSSSQGQTEQRELKGEMLRDVGNR